MLAEVDTYVFLQTTEAGGAAVLEGEEAGAKNCAGVVDAALTGTVEPTAEGHRGE